MIVGKLLPSVSKQVIQENINTYAEASGDHNPLHWDEHFAVNATHYGRIVAHGMLVLAYISVNPCSIIRNMSTDSVFSRGVGGNWVKWVKKSLRNAIKPNCLYMG